MMHALPQQTKKYVSNGEEIKAVALAIDHILAEAEHWDNLCVKLERFYVDHVISIYSK